MNIENSISKNLPREFGHSWLPDDATDDEIENRDLRDDARELAILPWRIERLAAMNKRHAIKRRVDTYANRVRELEAELRDARTQLVDAQVNAAAIMPELDDILNAAQHYYERARSAILSIGGPGSRWKFSRHNRIVSNDGKLDLANTALVVRIELDK